MRDNGTSAFALVVVHVQDAYDVPAPRFVLALGAVHVDPEEPCTRCPNHLAT
jgi:hypothetical protein